jgi:hypothetical protein
VVYALPYTIIEESTMSKDGKVVKMMTEVYPAVELKHANILKEAGYLNNDAYLDILALMHESARLERVHNYKVTAVCAVLGVLGSLALKFLL